MSQEEKTNICLVSVSRDTDGHVSLGMSRNDTDGNSSDMHGYGCAGYLMLLAFLLADLELAACPHLVDLLQRPHAALMIFFCARSPSLACC